MAVSGERDPILGIKALAAGLIDESGIPQPPFPPEILASFQNVREVRIVPMESAARLVPEPSTGKLRIEVNADHSLGKRNFSVNHETNHTLIPTYSRKLIDDAVTGTFASGSEEEYLCDVGAAALLLDDRWLRPLARQCGPSLETVFTLAALFGASLEATVRKLAGLDLWPCAFVFWEEGFRKSERVMDGQMMIDLLQPYGLPVPKLRVARSYRSRSFGIYIPDNKSVEHTSLIATCCQECPTTFGNEVFEFERSKREELYSENAHVPYRTAGVTHRRVLSFLMSTRLPRTDITIPPLFHLEVL